MANAGSFRKGEKRPNQGKHGPPKVINDVREMISKALSMAGGENYLLERAKDPRTASAFLALVGKTLPKEIKAEVAATHVIKSLTPEQQRGIAEAILGK